MTLCSHLLLVLRRDFESWPFLPSCWMKLPVLTQKSNAATPAALVQLVHMGWNQRNNRETMEHHNISWVNQLQWIRTVSILQQSMDWFQGKIYRRTLYFMVKTMVSCRFSLKPIHGNTRGNTVTLWRTTPSLQRNSTHLSRCPTVRFWGLLYPQVNQRNYGKSSCLIAKSTNWMAMFKRYEYVSWIHHPLSDSHIPSCISSSRIKQSIYNPSHNPPKTIDQFKKKHRPSFTWTTLFRARLVRIVPVEVMDISCLGASTVSDGSEASEMGSFCSVAPRGLAWALHRWCEHHSMIMYDIKINL